jgi:single-strand DNA-binding protein
MGGSVGKAGIMSAGFNQSILMGRLVAPPEKLTTKSGKPFLKAVIATSPYQKNSDGGSDERTSFVPVTIFGRAAEVFLEHVRKGEMVHLIGRLDSNEWKTDSGEKRLSLSFVIEQLNLLPNSQAKPRPSAAPVKATGSQPRSAAPVSSPAKAQPAKSEVDENGDPHGLPF